MNGNRRYLWNSLVIFCLVCATVPVKAQLIERICMTDYKINPEKKGELSIEVDNISFFKDNEFAGTVVKGYTLPGLWLQPKFVFYPLKNIKLEAGAHVLWYSGAYRYPSVAYQDIARWKGDQYQRGSHVLPYFRAQMAVSKSVNLVLGNIYGGSNHRLIEPLFNPELNLTTDPESGFQLLLDTRHLDLDVWVNWQSFIFKEDGHQEAFTLGLSSRVKFNDSSSNFHYYLPVQLLGQHRGGEIDTIYTNSVQTLINGAAGFGMTWNANRRVLKRVNLEADVAGYYQQSGEIWPFDKGLGIYAHASADLCDFRLRAGYWICNDFISLFGIPYYGAISTKEEGTTYDKPQTVYFSVEYSRSFGKHYAFGIKADAYQYFPGTMRAADGTLSSPGSSTSFSIGAYFRINPSFLLKKF